MPNFGPASLERRETLHHSLQFVADEGIKYFDFTIVCGYRDEAAQNKAFAKGHSTKQWPDSKHNIFPSIAMDVGPYDPIIKDIDWNNKERFIYLAAYLIGIASANGIMLRWGGDWDGDTFMKDERFIDRPHLELIGNIYIPA